MTRVVYEISEWSQLVSKMVASIRETHTHTHTHLTRLQCARNQATRYTGKDTSIRQIEHALAHVGRPTLWQVCHQM